MKQSRLKILDKTEHILLNRKRHQRMQSRAVNTSRDRRAGQESSNSRWGEVAWGQSSHICAQRFVQDGMNCIYRRRAKGRQQAHEAPITRKSQTSLSVLIHHFLKPSREPCEIGFWCPLYELGKWEITQCCQHHKAGEYTGLRWKPRQSCPKVLYSSSQ